MRSFLIFTFIFCLPWAAYTEEVDIKGYEILKVNHELLDQDGNTHQEIGNFVAKARYQRFLEESKKATGIRFQIHWRAPSSDIPNFAVKVDAYGFDADTDRETLVTLTKTYPQILNSAEWTTLDIKGDSFKRLSKLMAWKVTLLQNGQPVAIQKSFTWDDSLVASQKTVENK